MQLILTALGSYGDVLPMVGLGAMAKARGHSVRLIVNPYFAPVLAQAGLDFSPLGTTEEYTALTQHPDLWHPLRGPRTILQLGAREYLRKIFELLSTLYVPRKTVIGAHGLDLASRIFQDHCGAPVATIHFSPLAIRSVEATPAFFGMWTGSAAPRWVKALQFWLADRLVVDRAIGPAINDLRRELGLPNVSRIYHAWHQSPRLVLGLFPEWFAPVQADWPSCVRLAGFPLWDGNPDEPLDDEVRSFLQCGEPPIVFLPGSANAQAAPFFRTAVDACVRLGRRGILLSKFPEQIGGGLPEGVRHFSFVPLSRLLPHVAALAHHGGVGTSAQALACGVPQLVMPMAYDQLDNAVRLRRLGVGEIVRVAAWKTDVVAARLTTLMTSPDVANRCREFASRCKGTESLEVACAALEELDPEGT